ncbi:hypothetical protein [Escherichia coli]|nr:hypothetical protein [Escherichia coli]VVY16714.1 Uncharacterised protein [Escherichia coli]
MPVRNSTSRFTLQQKADLLNMANKDSNFHYLVIGGSVEKIDLRECMK